MKYTAENWPIAAALLQFPAKRSNGMLEQEAPASRWRDVAREISLEGFAHIDLMDTWLRPANLSKERKVELKESFDAYGVGFAAISVIRKSVIDPDEEKAQRNFDYIKRTIDTAAEYGVSIVSIGLHRDLFPAQKTAQWFWVEPGAIDEPNNPENWNLCVDRIGQLCEYAKPFNIELSLEMYEDTYIGTADSTLKLVSDIGASNLGINPDIGNLVRLHRPIENWEEMFIKLLPHSNYWHMKNYFRDEDPKNGLYTTTPAPMEFGFINYRRAIEIALESGYEGPLCVEHYGGDGLSVTAANREYIRRILRAKLAK